MDKADLFNIDENELDVHWKEQPRLYFKYAQLLANKRRDLEIAKAELALAEAEISRDILKDPKAFGLDGKPTVQMLDRTVILQPTYQQAQQAYFEAKRSVDNYQAMIDALDHKKKALENMTHLFAMNYFSTPREPKEMTDEQKERVKNERKKKSISRPKLKGGGDESD